MRRTLLTVAVLILAGCAKTPPATLDAALERYYQNKLDEALPMFEELAAADGAQARTWLAETYRRIGEKEEAVAEARKALDLDPRSSFAHTVIAEASNPVLGEWSQADSDTTWSHLMQAIECDSTDGHPWLVVFGEAMHRDDPAMVALSLQWMVRSGFLTKAALSYGRWMLAGLPPNAILLTNGDMDTYPPCAVQETEGFRRDVVVVNRGTLETKWQARYLRDRVGVPLPFDDAWLEAFTPEKDSRGYYTTLSDSLFRGWIAMKSRGEFDRPVTVAVTVGQEYLEGLEDRLRDAGAFCEWTPEDPAGRPDAAARLAGLAAVRAEDFTGPWVSERDRSPIRRMYTRDLVRNVTVTALAGATSLYEAGRNADAARLLDLAERIDRGSEPGPLLSKEIEELRKRIGEWGGNPGG